MNAIFSTTNDDRIRQHNETYLNVIVIFTTFRRKISEICSYKKTLRDIEVQKIMFYLVSLCGVITVALAITSPVLVFVEETPREFMR